MREFIVVLILFFSIKQNIKTSLVGAVLAGLIIDIWYGKLLGETALFYVMIAYIVNLYKRKYNAGHIFFILLTSFLYSILEVVYRTRAWIHYSRIPSIAIKSTLEALFILSILFLWQRIIVRRKK